MVDALIGEVAKKHLVLLDRDDPILVLATVIKHMLVEANDELGSTVQNITDQAVGAAATQAEMSKETAEQLVTNAAVFMTQQAKEAMRTSGQELLTEVRAVIANQGQAVKSAWWAATVAIGAAMLAGGTIGGYVLAGFNH